MTDRPPNKCDDCCNVPTCEACGPCVDHDRPPTCGDTCGGRECDGSCQTRPPTEEDLSYLGRPPRIVLTKPPTLREAAQAVYANCRYVSVGDFGEEGHYEVDTEDMRHLGAALAAPEPKLDAATQLAKAAHLVEGIQEVIAKAALADELADGVKCALDRLEDLEGVRLQAPSLQNALRIILARWKELKK